MEASFSFDSTVTGTTHHFDSTDALIDQVIDARIWGGMHYRSSGETGARLGKQVARWIAEHEFQPWHEDDSDR